jgi:hypothetical protein
MRDLDTRPSCAHLERGEGSDSVRVARNGRFVESLRQTLQAIGIIRYNECRVMYKFEEEFYCRVLFATMRH